MVIDFEDQHTKSVHLDNSVMLSFDDGPNEHTTEVLDILKEQNVVASFFVIGKYIKGNEGILKRIHEEGHQIGNHSFNHQPSFDWQSTSKVLEELKHTNHIIYEVLQFAPHLFRPPFGVTNPNIAKALKELGMTSVGWNVRSYDTIAKSEEQLLERILNRVTSRSIILLHESGPFTIKILPKLIQELRQRGYELSIL